MPTQTKQTYSDAQHPALILYKKLFMRAARKKDGTHPSYFAPNIEFYPALAAAGIKVPKAPIGQKQFEEEIGLVEFRHGLLTAYHKKHLTKPTPTERGEWRAWLERRKAAK